MYPVALNLKKIPILLVGSGELITRRLAMLKEAGATDVTVVKDATAADIAKATIVMVAGLSREKAERIATAARLVGKLVNVEDINELCDFYFTANVRRGDLIIAVSTSGASPTLARKVRDTIANIFGPEWNERVTDIAKERAKLKAEGKSTGEVMAAGEAYIKEKGWLA